MLQTYHHNGISFQYKVVKRKGRRHIGLRVGSDNIVGLYLPWRISSKHVPAIFKEHLPWITRKMAENEDKGLYRPKMFQDKESFLFLGQSYTLRILTGPKCGLHLYYPNMELTLTQQKLQQNLPETIKKVLTAWYRQEAKFYIDQRVNLWAKHIGVQPSAVRYRVARQRWGSCSTEGVICFNWKMIMAPPEVIDAIVIHELCHLIEHNHSPRFWALVQQHCPYYSVHKNWLDLNGHHLSF